MSDIKTVEDLIEKVLASLGPEIQAADPAYNADILRGNVENAISELRLRRNYTASSMTEEQIIADMANNYSSVIRNVAAADYAKRGAYGEISHSENGVSRSYHDRDDLFRSVHAFVQFVF